MHAPQLLQLLTAAALAAAGVAIVCPPDFCQRVLCAPMDPADCFGVVLPNGGFCGCCPSCAPYRGVGESCLQNLLRGVPSHVTCVPGTACQDGVCTAT